METTEKKSPTHVEQAAQKVDRPYGLAAWLADSWYGTAANVHQELRNKTFNGCPQRIIQALVELQAKKDTDQILSIVKACSDQKIPLTDQHIEQNLGAMYFNLLQEFKHLAKQTAEKFAIEMSPYSTPDLDAKKTQLRDALLKKNTATLNILLKNQNDRLTLSQCSFIADYGYSFRKKCTNLSEIALVVVENGNLGGFAYKHLSATLAN